MKPCHRVDSLLSAYIEEEASPAEIMFVDGHLTVCSRCRDSVTEVARLLEHLSRLPRPRASSTFTEQVLARVRDLPAAGLEEPIVPRLRFSPAPWSLGLAAAAAVAVLLFGLTRIGFREQDADRAENVKTSPAPGAARRATRLPSARSTGVQTPVGAPHEVRSLSEERPELKANATGGEEPLGMSKDAYVLEDWMLREPAGGGSPILTRVGANPGSPVLVTF